MIVKIDVKHIAEKMRERKRSYFSFYDSEEILQIIENEYKLVSEIEKEWDALENPGPTNAGEDKERRGEF